MPRKQTNRCLSSLSRRLLSSAFSPDAYSRALPLPRRVLALRLCVHLTLSLLCVHLYLCVFLPPQTMVGMLEGAQDHAEVLDLKSLGIGERTMSSSQRSHRASQQQQSPTSVTQPTPVVA